MDKQKQIEEMEKDIAVCMPMAKSVAGSMNSAVEDWLGKYLIERGWEKIPEGAVVLTREQMCEIVSNHNEINRQACKETAEKFARGFINDILPKIMNGHSEKALQIAMAMTNYCNEITEGV